jgi:hypothetical protein
MPRAAHNLGDGADQAIKSARKGMIGALSWEKEKGDGYTTSIELLKKVTVVRPSCGGNARHAKDDSCLVFVVKALQELVMPSCIE